jgi:transposase
MPLRTEALPTVTRRISAGQMLMGGSSISAVAEALHLSTATVKRYKAILEDGGLAALEGMSVGGRASALDGAALQWVADALRGSARAHGFASDAWTNARLRELIETRFGVSYSRVYAWQIATNLGLGDRLSKSSR